MRAITVYGVARAVLLVATCVLVLTVGSTAAPQSTTLRARADIRGEGISGAAEFREVSSESAGATDPKFPVGTIAVEVTLRVRGLKPGPHGVHIHEVGKCDPTFAAAGGHFDPGPHGMSDPDANHPYHMGDLPNLIANELGEGHFTARTTRFTLSPGPLSIFDEDGSAIVVHADPDQGITGEPKSGVAGGARVACGVITKVP
jgi:Cu-Zn family superoxide dismutase